MALGRSPVRRQAQGKARIASPKGYRSAYRYNGCSPEGADRRLRQSLEGKLELADFPSERRGSPEPASEAVGRTSFVGRKASATRTAKPHKGLARMYDNALARHIIKITPIDFVDLVILQSIQQLYRLAVSR